IVGVVGVPLGLLCPTRLLQAGDHRVAPGQILQFAVGGVPATLILGQVPELAWWQQVEVAAQYPGRSCALQLLQQAVGHGYLALHGVITLGEG
ncbi:hypothetical protein RSW84_25180, partial [Escherichia coli]|uniref:hypothetical protein n=1 Tax=Escherichia coli TaxID=562 RepID=UPI0028E0957F